MGDGLGKGKGSGETHHLPPPHPHCATLNAGNISSSSSKQPTMVQFHFKKFTDVTKQITRERKKEKCQIRD